jgi:hypothetical protein
MNGQHRVSGRQITVMVIAICLAAVLAPVGVFAATRSTVSIADGTHPSHLAHVTKSGAQVVNVTGSTTITGKVTAAPGAPAIPFLTGGSATGGAVLNFSIPAGARLVLQTVSVRIQVPAAVTTAGAQVEFVENGLPATLYIPAAEVSPRDGSAPALFMATEPAVIYPDPGSILTVSTVFDSTAEATMTVTISGYRA